MSSLSHLKSVIFDEQCKFLSKSEPKTDWHHTRFILSLSRDGNSSFRHLFGFSSIFKEIVWPKQFFFLWSKLGLYRVIFMKTKPKQVVMVPPDPLIGCTYRLWVAASVEIRKSTKISFHLINTSHSIFCLKTLKSANSDPCWTFAMFVSNILSSIHICLNQ